MEDNNIEQGSPVEKKPELYNKTIKVVARPENTPGLDNQGDIITQILSQGEVSAVDISTLEKFTQVSNNRNQLYKILDYMAQDSLVAAIIKTYAEDCTEYNDEGHIIWADSNDEDVNKYVNYLIKEMQFDKNAYKWILSLIKYGDVYWRLPRRSELKKDTVFDNTDDDIFNKATKQLNEDIVFNVPAENDRYIGYLDMEPNPALMFELTRYDKTSGFIKTSVITEKVQDVNSPFGQVETFQYNFKKNDIKLFKNTDYVHATLMDDVTRTPEKVTIFNDDVEDMSDENSGMNYTVKRGQSLLYTWLPSWREMNLLDKSLVLNRTTKSSVIRVVNVQTKDMPKEQVQPLLQRIKTLMEQKAALNENKSLTEYTNPGPIENTIYVPVNGEEGTITVSQIGGDVNISSLPDVMYITNKFFGATGTPKQYFGMTEDSTGFNGGTSLSIISSRYAKGVKRIQNSLLQALTSAINLVLLDRDYGSYIGKFTLHMQPPTTQEEIDRREAELNRIGVISDTMNLLSEVENPVIKLSILKTLMGRLTLDGDVLDLLQKEIDNLKENGVETGADGNPNEPPREPMTGGGSDLDLDAALDLEPPEEEIELGVEENPETSSEANLPSPEELGQDFTDFED